MPCRLTKTRPACKKSCHDRSWNQSFPHIFVRRLDGRTITRGRHGIFPAHSASLNLFDAFLAATAMELAVQVRVPGSGNVSLLRRRRLRTCRVLESASNTSPSGVFLRRLASHLNSLTFQNSKWLLNFIRVLSFFSFSEVRNFRWVKGQSETVSTPRRERADGRAARQRGLGRRHCTLHAVCRHWH